MAMKIIWRRTLLQQCRQLASRLRADIRFDNSLPGSEIGQGYDGALSHDVFVNEMLKRLEPLCLEYERLIIKHFEDNPPRTYPAPMPQVPGRKQITLSNLLGSMTPDEISRMLQTLKKD